MIATMTWRWGLGALAAASLVGGAWPSPLSAIPALPAAPAARVAVVAVQDAPLGSPASQVDSLLADGLLQEAAWAAREGGDTARGERILARLDSMLHAPPTAAKPLSMEQQGVSYTWRLGHGGGVESIFKKDGSDMFCPECGADREVAAYLIDRLLGFDLTPATVYTEVTDDDFTLTGSAQYFVHGASTPEEVGATKPDRLLLFDAILGNSDRHETNWLILESGRVVAIDHNRAFDYQPSPRARTCWEREVDAIRRPGALGEPFDRYRSMPAAELEAAVAGVLDPALTAKFAAMRGRVVARIEARIADPGTKIPYEDCSAPEDASR